MFTQEEIIFSVIVMNRGLLKVTQMSRNHMTPELVLALGKL